MLAYLRRVFSTGQDRASRCRQSARIRSRSEADLAAGTGLAAVTDAAASSFSASR